MRNEFKMEISKRKFIIEEMKNLKMGGFLTFYFKGSDETEAEDRIQRILLQDN